MRHFLSLAYFIQYGSLKSISSPADDIILFLFMLECDSILVICHTFFVYLSIGGHQGYKLAIGNIDTISGDIYVSLCYINHLLRKDGAMNFQWWNKRKLPGTH